jgi:hypothetical protein
MNMIVLSGTENCKRRVYCRVSGEEVAEVKAERVSRAESWVVGAESGGGGGFLELKPEIDQRTMQSSLSHLERMRSLWNATLLDISRYSKTKREVMDTNLRAENEPQRSRSVGSVF